MDEITRLFGMKGRIKTYDEGLVMLLKLTESSACLIGRHSDTEGPFVNGRRVLLVVPRGYERLHDKPTPEVDTTLNNVSGVKEVREVVTCPKTWSVPHVQL